MLSGGRFPAGTVKSRLFADAVAHDFAITRAMRDSVGAVSPMAVRIEGRSQPLWAVFNSWMIPIGVNRVNPEVVGGIVQDGMGAVISVSISR